MAKSRIEVASQLEFSFIALVLSCFGEQSSKSLRHGSKRSRQRSENITAVAGTEQVFRRTLRMRHHSHDVTRTIANTGYIIARAVRIGLVSNATIKVAIAKNNSIFVLQFGQRRIVANIVSFGVRDRHAQ